MPAPLRLWRRAFMRWGYALFLLSNLGLIAFFIEQDALSAFSMGLLHLGNVLLLAGLELLIPLNPNWLLWQSASSVDLDCRSNDLDNGLGLQTKKKRAGLQKALFLKTYLWYLIDSRLWFRLHAYLLYGAAHFIQHAVEQDAFWALPASLQMSAYSFGLQVLILALGIDLLRYGIHRLSHRVHFLWRWHTMHHMPTHMTPVRAWWTHPVDDILLYGPEVFIFILFDFNPTAVLAYLAFDNLFQLLNHANCQLNSGFLGLLFQHPRYHLLHHRLAGAADTVVNFGEMFTIWDRIFKTFAQVELSEIKHLQIGILPLQKRTLGQQLLQPFKRQLGKRQLGKRKDAI